MNVSDVPKGVVKDLALLYQNTGDGAVFERILFRVDRLVQHVMHREQKKWKHLRSEDPQDIYQAACIGLSNGINKIKVQDTPNQVVLKIMAYIQAEIRKEYPMNRSKFYTTDEKIIDEPVYRNLESECLGQVYQELIKEGVLTQLEYNLMCLRYIQEVPWRTIAQSVGMNIDSVKQMVYNARNRMRHQLRIRGITDGG